ncbi:DegT/DnrJ/EryC1/StrS family aminotransferase [Psychrobacter alimentarius]|uniref:DegT/DnrJ/EryC1/StrS family aminotransferase n=1 Tax=Psychrobacter alimentarius TaxID=261164 RepID=UPI00191B471F|nr:DegT/DnrJ/EryC1/StrS family aminotransferase [Psychrobacter alimentarius]
MTINFIDLERQQHRIKREIDEAISRVLKSGQYIMGEECLDLEKQLAEYTGRKYCISCANGTDAIRIALVALGIEKGSFVLTTDFTFFATSEVIAELGAIPVFVDIDETYNICLLDLEKKILELKGNNKKLVGILSVDLFGLPANHTEIDRLAVTHGLWHIEDAAQGFGGRLNNNRACSFGNISTTSFFPAKPLGCYGDGGAIFTDSLEIADYIKSLRVHGKGTHKYENINIGYNSRLDTIQASILIEKLKIFDSEVLRKNEVAAMYTLALKEISEISVPVVPKGYSSSWAQYTLRVEKREELRSYLKEKGIPTAVYYPKTMSQTKALNLFSEYQIGEVKNSVNFVKSVLSLPMHAYLTDNEVQYICENILKFYNY